jgi:hypothetical protein
MLVAALTLKVNAQDENSNALEDYKTEMFVCTENAAHAACAKTQCT